MGSLPHRARVRIFLESRKPAADHAGLQSHQADRAQPHAHAVSAAWAGGRKGRWCGLYDRHLISRFPFMPVRAKWIARITEFEWNHCFADMHDRGPFKSWHHRHEFQAETRDGVTGTLVPDVIEYEVGSGFLGTIANAIFVRRQMQSTFAQRQQVLPKLLSRLT